MQSRKVLFSAVFLLLIVAGYFGWRALHPAQSDAQIIIAKLEGMAQAATGQNARGVVAPMTDTFRWQNLNKREINSHLGVFFWNTHTVEALLSDMTVQVNGAQATVEGAFRVTYRAAPDAANETKAGRFRTRWIKRDGDWKLDGAEGADNLNLAP